MEQTIALWKTVAESNLPYIAKAPAALATLVIAYFVLLVVRRMIRQALILARVDPIAQSMVNSVIGFVGWILAISAALNVLELNQLSLALGGSVALVAMALATGLNSVTQDLLAGVFLLGDPSFKVGNRVKAGGVEGSIVELSIRKTRVRDDNGNLHTIPNRTIDQATYVLLEPKDDPKDE